MRALPSQALQPMRGEVCAADTKRFRDRRSGVGGEVEGTLPVDASGTALAFFLRHGLPYLVRSYASFATPLEFSSMCGLPIG